MSYQDLLNKARALKPEEINGNLLSLMGDARFAAVVAWLEANREEFVALGSSQKLSKEHGPLAHCQGSIHALRVLEGQLKHLLDPRPPRRSPEPPPA